MMEVFVAASSTVLLAIVGYLFWLGVCQRRLSRAVRAAQSQLDEQASVSSAHADIAA
jgi:hypothetical protein